MPSDEAVPGGQVKRSRRNFCKTRRNEEEEEEKRRQEQPGAVQGRNCVIIPVVVRRTLSVQVKSKSYPARCLGAFRALAPAIAISRVHLTHSILHPNDH